MTMTFDRLSVLRFNQLSIILVALLVLGGCRMYGGYGTVEATQDAIAAETSQASEELEAAGRTLRVLQQAAETDRRLMPFAETYAYIHETHGEMVADYESELEKYRSSGSYRVVSRRLGAMLTEQRRIENAYQELAESAAIIIDSDRVPELAVPARMYGVYPAVYYAWWHAERVNAVDQVVRSTG